MFLLNSSIVAKLTMVTELAIATKKAKPKVLLPSEYADYAQVFSKKATDHIPPDKGLRVTSQGWDQLRTTLQSTVSNQE